MYYVPPDILFCLKFYAQVLFKYPTCHILKLAVYSLLDQSLKLQLYNLPLMWTNLNTKTYAEALDLFLKLSAKLQDQHAFLKVSWEFSLLPLIL